MPVKGATHHVMLEAADEMDRFVEAYLPIAGYDASQPDSPSEAEERAGLPRSAMPGVDESVLYHARWTALWRTYAGLDCFEGLASCVRTVASVLAVYPLGRTAMEGFAAAAWLLEPGIGPEVRAYRGMLDHQKSLKAQLGTLHKQANHDHPYWDEKVSAHLESVAYYEGLLACLEADLAATRPLLPDPATREPLPSLTDLVDGALAGATEQSVGPGVYSQFCEIVHPGAFAVKQLVNSGTTERFLNVSLSEWVWPLLTTCWLMEHCLVRRAEYYGLPSTDLYLKPVLDALYGAVSLQPGTLLLQTATHALLGQEAPQDPEPSTQ